jgi:acetate kinase
MIILVINAGSSSVKFTLFRMEDEAELASGIVGRIGLAGTRLNYKNFKGGNLGKEVFVADAVEAVGIIAGVLTDDRYGVIDGEKDITAVGHRVVHGGEKITDSVIIEDSVKEIIKKCSTLAPLHNPHNFKGIEASERHFPGALQVAVFDTAFHATIPEHAFLYGLPYRLYHQDRIRRYGFHGISHKHVSGEAARFLDMPLDALKLITCHLGNGCSITAVEYGKSIDTSMGFTPLEGLMMGSRCGDLDPAIVLFLMEHKQLGYKEINELLNKQSGLLGVADIGSSDLRDILSAKASGNHQAGIAVKTFTYRIKKYIGAYIAAMGGVDAIVFTAGIGENSPIIRESVCDGLQRTNGLKIILDPEKNKAGNNRLCEIQSRLSRVKILVVPTNEAREIAQQTLQLLQPVEENGMT